MSKKTYEQACKKSAALLGKGASVYSVVRTLREEKYPTRRGGHGWGAKSVKAAAERGGYKAKGKKYARKALAVANEELAKGNQRKPLKRMVSQTEWESMPEGLQQAVVAEIIARLG